MNAPAELMDLARQALQSAREGEAPSGVGALDAFHRCLAQSAQQLEAAVTRLGNDPASRGPEAQRSLQRFQAALRMSAALHRSAGTLCAEWGRALRGPGGQAYAPPGGRGVPPLVSGGRRVSVEG